MSVIFDTSHINWSIYAEQRTRLIRKTDADFSSAAADNQTQLDDRTRVGVNFRMSSTVSGQLVYQYIHSLYWTPKKNYSDDGSDLYLGNVSIRTAPGTWTVGRQVISKGAKRLIDNSDFSQRSKVFDVVRFKNDKWDFFGGRIGMTSQIRDHSRLGMSAFNWGEAGETMLIYHTDDKTNVNDYTLDHRYDQDFGPINAELEGAVQKGRVQGKDLDGFWAHARLQFDSKAPTSLYSEVNVVSGGSSGGTTHLFDPLYGTGHAPYGLLDVQGLRNLRHFEFGVIQKFGKKLSGIASFNGYGLYSRSDGWYNTGGNINKRPGGSLVDPTGKSGSDVGNELNFAMTWTPTKRDTITFEIGVFNPGNFVKKLIGPSTTREVYGLLGYSGKF